MMYTVSVAGARAHLPRRSRTAGSPDQSGVPRSPPLRVQATGVITWQNRQPLVMTTGKSLAATCLATAVPLYPNLAAHGSTCEQLIGRRVGGADQPHAVVVQLVHQRDETPRLVPCLRAPQNQALISALAHSRQGKVPSSRCCGHYQRSRELQAQAPDSLQLLQRHLGKVCAGCTSNCLRRQQTQH